MALRIGLCALVLVAFAVAVGADDRPPSSLHLVGDHWTAWSPPTTSPPDSKLHVVEKGDTLWALSQRFLGNSYLWPQIWEKNQYVLDAHWIYPGDPLVVGLEVAPAERADAGAGAAAGAGVSAPAAGGATAGEESDEDAAGAVRPDSAEARRNTPVPLGSDQDIHCTGYLADEAETLPWAINGSEYDALTPRLIVKQNWGAGEGVFGSTSTVKYQMSLGDVVYLDSGRSAGVSPGMVLVSIEARETIRHPLSGAKLGRFHAYLGRVRVLAAQEDRAIAEVVHNCEGLRVGSRLKTFEPEPVPLARRPQPRPVNDPTTNDLSSAPTIVHADRNIFSIGEDHVVYIDRGEDDDVYPGDLFTIYRTTNSNQPPVAVGELAVLSVRPHTSLGKVVESRYVVYLGDRLERH